MNKFWLKMTLIAAIGILFATAGLAWNEEGGRRKRP